MEFYQSIAIKSGPDWELAKDIRDVWDSSRFSHARTLVKENPDVLISQIKDWIGANPYRYGPNWVNPMEVALRAMNWIYAMAELAHLPPKDISAELISCSLYDHFVYLEHNWEYYDGRTNNHYLSNLVGYLACCWYFMPLGTQKKAQWAAQELVREMQKTVFPEGTSYEGSTAYHGLVTELYEHGFYFVGLLELSVPVWAQERLARMQEFARLTKNLHIGDNDRRGAW